MRGKKFKYIYGPVSSWRLGASLGIDLLSTKEKVCNFNCIYCQVGKTKVYPSKRKIYVPTREIIKELKRFPRLKVDYITFSGVGEPTLAKNLGQTIKAIRRLRKEPIAVLTNSALISKKDVREELTLADFVIVKLDAVSQASLRKINRPKPGINLEEILWGIKRFRSEYKGKLGLQIMFISQNKDQARLLADICREIKPDEIQINTPLRKCHSSPLSKKEVFKIRNEFVTFCNICVYEAKRKKVSPINTEDVKLRRSKNK